MDTVKLTQVVINDTKKDGTKLRTKKGELFYKVSIKTDKYGDDWFSTLAFNQDDKAMHLQQGDEVDIIIEEKDGFKNFKLPNRMDSLETRIVLVENRIKAMENYVFKKSVPNQITSSEIQADDLPF
jgi:hypothetical protein